jgi:predicted Holliday junction resolvase-like endonuclease
MPINFYQIVVIHNSKFIKKKMDNVNTKFIQAHLLVTKLQRPIQLRQKKLYRAQLNKKETQHSFEKINRKINIAKQKHVRSRRRKKHIQVGYFAGDDAEFMSDDET